MVLVANLSQNMIHASLYYDIYLLLVTILTIATYSQYKNRDEIYEVETRRSDILAVLIVVFMSLFIGLRPLDGRYFGDMANYAEYYHAFYEGINFVFERNTENMIFDNLFAWWGANRFGYTSFFVLLAVIYFGASYWGISKLFPNDRLAAYLVFLAAFSTFSYSTNGIKAGAAAALFIGAMGVRDNLKICIPLILISWGFHHSMVMPVAAFIITMFIKNSKLFFALWFFCLIMALGHVTTFAHLFAQATTEQGAGYLLGDATGDGTKGGFRFDFILYSSMPVIVGWYVCFKKRLELSDTYINLLNLYLCLNGIWMLCMYASYTNRIAYLSWFLYPIVLIYPFLQEEWGDDRYQKFSYVMLAHLGFTLFMQIIYY